MNAALMAQIQGGKGLRKVPAHEKNDRSEVQTRGGGGEIHKCRIFRIQKIIYILYL